MPGTLYLVATPIGNLQDMSLRAVDILRSVDVIACEDTRHSRKLLNHFSISNKLISYHEHNEEVRSAELIEKLSSGSSVAVISDAGTPGICDPAFRIVQRAIENAVNVVPIPGAVAFVNAVVASGLATDSIFFGGFLPAKTGERRRRLEEVREIPATLLFYEAPHRLIRSLLDCSDILGDRPAAVARELTKIHEEIVRGRLTELSRSFAIGLIKGEIVLVIGREQASVPEQVLTTKSLSNRVKDLEAAGNDPRSALKQAAKEFGISKSAAYRQLKIKG